MDSLPEKLWRIIKAWVEGKKTGSLTLHVKDGNVLEVEKQERIKLT